MSDAMTPDRARLVELAEARRTSLASLSAMLGRNPSYLQQFVRKGSPRKLEEADRRRLAEFFGVSEVELGADPDHARASAPDEFITVPRLPLDASPDVLPALEALLRTQGHTALRFGPS